MPGDVKRTKLETQEVNQGEHVGGQDAASMATSSAPRNAREARDNFVGWLRFYMRTRGIDTDAKLAALLGVSRGRVSQLFKKEATTEPKLELLLAAKRLTGYPIDVLVSTPPDTQ